MRASFRNPLGHLILIILGVTAVMTTGPGHATEKTVRLATGPNYAPFTDPGLPNGGMITEMMRRIFKEAGYDVEVSFLPWKRAYEATRAGHFDGSFPWVRTAEREKDFRYSDNIYATSITAFTLVRSRLAQAKIHGLKNKTICRPIGYFMPQPLKRMHESGMIRHHQPNSMADCFRDLLAGRSDAVIVGLIEGRTNIRKLVGSMSPLLERANIHAEDDFATLDWVIPGKKLHLIVPHGSQRGIKVLARFNAAAAQLDALGVLAEIRDRHLERFDLGQ